MDNLEKELREMQKQVESLTKNSDHLEISLEDSELCFSIEGVANYVVFDKDPLAYIQKLISKAREKYSTELLEIDVIDIGRPLAHVGLVEYEFNHYKASDYRMLKNWLEDIELKYHYYESSIRSVYPRQANYRRIIWKYPQRLVIIFDLFSLPIPLAPEEQECYNFFNPKVNSKLGYYQVFISNNLENITKIKKRLNFKYKVINNIT